MRAYGGPRWDSTALGISHDSRGWEPLASRPNLRMHERDSFDWQIPGPALARGAGIYRYAPAEQRGNPATAALSSVGRRSRAGHGAHPRLQRRREHRGHDPQPPA